MAMAQMQNGRRAAAATDVKPATELAYYTSAENFQRIFNSPQFVNAFEYQQALVDSQPAGANEQPLCHGQENALAVLNGESLAQLTLNLPISSSNPYGLKIAHASHQFPQQYFPDLNSPISISSPSSISSQDSFCHSRRESLAFTPQYDPSVAIKACVPQASLGVQASMPYANMADKRVPSTPQSIQDEYQVVQQLIQQSNAAPYSSSLDEGYHPRSGPSTAYNSPASNQWYSDQFEDRHAGFQARHEVMTPQYEWRGSPETHFAQPFPPQYTQTSTMVPAPRVSESRARRTSTPPPPKARKTKQKADKSKIPHITQPLSELTKDMDVPVRDMEEWVNRPASQRQKEAEKRNGYVARPMNSFMLYRSAYAERTKQWCLQNNHQVVSSVSGESWPLEPEHIREKYNELARIERDNHQKAHPGYKFSPSKANPAAKKRKGNTFGSEEEVEDDEQEGSDYDWLPNGAKKGRSRQRTRREDIEASLNPIQYAGPSPYSYPDQLGITMGRPIFEYPNPGRPLPQALEEVQRFSNPQGQFYSHTVPNRPERRPMDIRINRQPQPVPSQPPSGLPGASHDDLFGSFDQHGTNDAYGNLNVGDLNNDSFLDPSLASLDPGHSGGNFTERAFRELDGDFLATQEAIHDASGPSEPVQSMGAANGSNWPENMGDMPGVFDENFDDLFDQYNKGS